MNRRRIIISVTNDLYTDQRVLKVCDFLQRNGLEIVLVGRMRKDSPPLQLPGIRIKRFRLLFDSGVLFYAAYHFRLFLFLLFTRCDYLLANDLDTLLPNYFVARIRNKKLFYDTHEYFTEVPELAHAPLKKKMWQLIEEIIFPRLQQVYTVNSSIAEVYQKKYQVKVSVVRNLPVKLAIQPAQRSTLGLPEQRRIVILQGAGINIHRGAEELLEALVQIENVLLLVVGNGDVIDVLKRRAAKADLNGKVKFIPKLPYAQMMQYTQVADAGVSLDKDISLNYRYSLPNKLFDYVQAGIPVLASDLPEIKRIFSQYRIGEITASHAPEAIAEKLNYLFTHAVEYKAGIESARRELTWEKEIAVLQEIYAAIIPPSAAQ
jgi:glycosyltransferase involved in cell wall biosynthesis